MSKLKQKHRKLKKENKKLKANKPKDIQYVKWKFERDEVKYKADFLLLCSKFGVNPSELSKALAIRYLEEENNSQQSD